MVCPICGRKSEVGVFCSECYLKKNLKLELPGVVELQHCPRCGAYLLKGRWVRELDDETAVKNAVENEIKTNIKGLKRAGVIGVEIEKAGKGYEATVTAAVGGAEMRRQTKVRMKNVACPECSRIAGGYFEAVLQLRGGVGKKTVDRIVREIEGHKDKYAFVSEVRKVRGGYDVYLGSKKSAEKIVRGFRGEAEIKKSFKQAGMDKQTGKTRSRFYYLIRI